MSITIKKLLIYGKSYKVNKLKKKRSDLVDVKSSGC